jgi:exodeoxyribonuclease-5
VKVAQQRGMKILAVGDAGQLPPVKQEAIPFPKFRRQSTLRQIVRQAEGSAIISVAWAIREGKPWRQLEGAGLRKVAPGSLGDAFLEAVAVPGERPEEDREVYVAYRNVNVNAMSEKACQKLYGHGRLAFAPGELVLSESNFYRNKTLLCANQDELVVTQFHEEDRDPTIGVPVTLRHRTKRGEFQAHYLAPEQLTDKQHPYNLEMKRLEGEAQRLQAEYNVKKKGPRSTALEDLDRSRKQAWVNFFAWRDQTIISFRHPFAITSHKSQGSTYRSVFVDVTDLARCSSHALYVAVTRPREELVVAE